VIGFRASTAPRGGTGNPGVKLLLADYGAGITPSRSQRRSAARPGHRNLTDVAHAAASALHSDGWAYRHFRVSWRKWSAASRPRSPLCWRSR